MPGHQQPLSKFRFQLDFGAGSASFSEVTGIESETDVIEYRESGSDIAIHKLPGLTKYRNIELRRGFTTNLELWQWFQSKDRRPVSIILLDETLQPVLRFAFRNAWPCKSGLSDLDAGKNEVAIESLTLAHEGFSVEAL